MGCISIDYNESLWYRSDLDDLRLPDPFVFVEGDSYYIVGTNERNVNTVDCYVTEYFVTYELHRDIYDHSLYKGWESDSAEIYAPEIKSGDFYCSTGPKIEEILVENGVVKIRSSPVSFICVSTDTRQIYSQKANNTLLLEAEFYINWYFKLSNEGTNEHQYIRITLIDEKGRRAFSRPYFIDEIKG